MQIYIGADNFSASRVAHGRRALYQSREQVVGAIGVVGPTRINYARIIPMVDYTAKVIGRMLG